MTYEETKITLLAAYPMLFLDEGEVLHHLFFVNGNGYRWRDGELVSKYVETERPDVEACRLEEIQTRKDWLEIDPDNHYLREDGTVGTNIYPICEYAKIMNVPEDVKPDWYAAAKEAIHVARTRYRVDAESEQLLQRAQMLILAMNRE